MNRYCTFFVFLFVALSAYAEESFNTAELQYYYELIDSARKDNDIDKEGKARLQRICFFYNYDLLDSLYEHVPNDMEFSRAHGRIEEYYDLWNHKANALTFEGKVNTGLRELKKMHDDAVKRDEYYGLALSYYGMGNAYISMEHVDEAAEAYRKSLDIILANPIKDHSVELDLFSYYCDVLYLKKNFTEMLRVIDLWYATIQREQPNPNTPNAKIRYAYYYLGCAQAHLGLNQLERAAMDLDEVEKRSNIEGEYIYMIMLYYRAQLYLQQGDYDSALVQNTRCLNIIDDASDVSSAIMVRKQRAEILGHLKQFEESAAMYLEMSQMKDSFYTRSIRDQIAELNTLYRVDEFEIEKQLTRSRFVTLIAIVVGLSFLLFLIYWWITSRRLRRKNEELTIAHAKAQESSLMKTKFIHSISHEVRTPLNVLSGFSQILVQSKNLPDEVKVEAYEKIEESSKRITTLISRLLSLSESVSQTVIVCGDVVFINYLCSEAITTSGVANDNRHRFSFASDFENDEIVETSKRHVQKAISHLLENAMEFTPDGGDIRMLCRKSDDMLKIVVEDTGCGIPAAESERIFEEFVKLDEFRTGVGVGLTLSRNIIRRMGGDIRLDTSYTDGARFILLIPLHK